MNMESADALMEEQKLLTEAKYRNYMSNIDKALRNFEYSSEWADLISALGKLSKAISSNTQYQVIPRRIKISKRLAQCMHPALPSGVHLKALETYYVIFSKTGPERLATELFIYSSGLFPLLGYAAMNVRPALLDIYETFFVPLGEKLRPALSGFLSGVLPGYENGLDHFERTSSLLSQVCAAVNPTHFYTVLWECVATNASIRLPAITFLLDHFNRRLSMQEQVYIMGHNRDVMMSALCACLNDAVILVQRNTLEFLLLGFPMHTLYLSEADLIKLVTNGLNTILRRDMSLNRRLYSWLLGTEVAKNSPTSYDAVSVDGTNAAQEEQQESYFEKHSKHILIQGIICTLRFSLESQPVDLKPYRIMVSLLDKAEIGSAVLDHVLCDIVRTMSLSSGNVEVIKSANLLFATFDPAYIWSFMTSIYEQSCKKTNKNKTHNNNNSSKQPPKSLMCNSNADDKFHCIVGSGDPCLVEICFLTEFLLETISLEMYNETTRIYLPKVFLAICQMLTLHLPNINSEEVCASLKVCTKIVSRVQPMISSPVKLLPRQQHATGSSSSADEKSNKSKNSKNGNALKQNNVPGVAVNALEKSKSDSKLNQFHHDATTSNSANSQLNNNDFQAELIVRSPSSQQIEPPRHKSPKKKKAKSYSKLSELDKEICPDTGQIIEPQQSSSDLDTPLSIKKLKFKAKTPYMRIRASPKKMRPKDIALNAAEPKSLDDALLKPRANTMDAPKSAPAVQQHEQQPTGIDTAELAEELEEFSFDYSDGNVNNDEEFGILEKCIRQYEVFFEVYLSRMVLQIVEPSTPCAVKVQLDDGTSKNDNLNVENIFMNEQVYEDHSTERLLKIEKLFETLCVRLVSRSKQLQSLLQLSLAAAGGLLDSASDYSDTEMQRAELEQQESRLDAQTEQRIQTIIDLHLPVTLRNAVKLAANLLVEMSTFPNCQKNVMLDKTEKRLPSWLKVLCLVAAYMQQDKELQLAAITTLFDLISLLKSQIEHTTSPGVTFVVMLPLLKFGHVSYLENKTRVFQLITSTLWNYLGETDTDPVQITALLYQLHNCLESGLVEKIIGNRMYAHCMQQQFSAANELLCNNGTVAEKALKYYRRDRASDIQLICISPSHNSQRHSLEQLKESEAKSLKKFELLWHLGRDKKPSKGFEKTLLKVLDTLSLPYYMSARTFVTKWLQSALLRGDLSRLIKPLYKILLAPNSKRIGIVHLSLMRQNGDDSTVIAMNAEEQADDSSLCVEHDVYAISSEYGNIKYHMDLSAMHKKRSPIRNFHKKIFGVALSSKNKTANFLTGDKTALAHSDNSKNASMPLPMVEAVQEAPMGLIINPLDNSPDFDDEMEYEQQQPVMETKVQEAMETSKNEVEAGGQQPEADSAEEEDELDDEHNCERDYTDESDSSSFESESENRETSVEKDDSLTQSSNNTLTANNAGSMKRFVGDTETVTEMLSQHERTKNRKTYRLSHEKSTGDASLTSVTDETLATTTANADTVSMMTDDYFNAKKHALLDSEEQQSTRSNTPNLSIGGAAAEKRVKQQRASKQKKKKFLTSSEKKRMSCISKTSTDSNSSYAGNMQVIENSDDEQQHQQQKEPTQDCNNSTTINVEEKRRNLSLETTKSKAVWGLSAETLEKSKQNVQVLRDNVAAVVQPKTAADANNTSTEQRRSSSGKSGNGNSSSSESRNLQIVEKLHLFHNHMLVYLGVYDTKQTLYAFQTLRNIIACDTRTFLCLSITTSFSSGTLKQLLIRQRKCISGKGFAGNITNSEFAQNYRGCMHLEVLVTICLYYARGFFYLESNDGTKQLPKHEDILGNCRVQLESIELLSLICNELIDIVKGMGKGLACYIVDLMMRCKLQKVILHCLNSAVNSYAHFYTGHTLAEQILNFNNPNDQHLHAESFQIQLLRLLKAVIKLEYEIMLLKNDNNTASTSVDKEQSSGNISPTRLGNNAENAVKYLPNCLISQQPMFLAAVLSALQDERLRHLHRNWTDLVTSSLNCFSFGSLTNIVISVVHQLCNNVDRIARLTLKEQSSFPPDYVVSQLEAITILCHYCLLDNTQQTTLSHLFNQAYPQTSVASQSSNTGQLLNSIVHSFLSSAAVTAQAETHVPRKPQLLSARNAVLSHLSRIVASVAAVWDSELGQVRPVKQQLMEFLSPVSLHHGVNFLAAVAVTWQERGERQRKRQAHGKALSIVEQYQRNSMLQACPEQLSLVTLVSSIRVMPMDSFVQTLHQVVKSPPPIHRPPAQLAIEVSALELFYFYLKSAPAPQLSDSWSSLLILIRDGLSLSAPAQFALLMLLNEFVQRCPQMPFQDKKDIRDMHDITSRLVDSLSNVAGSCLEQTTWLRRNLAVKEDISPTASDGSARDTGLVGNQQYSVQAQSVLAAILANLLDVAYGSQEKDKVVTIITTLLYNITPYLKTHTTRNVPAFYACSSLLASLSGFQYTRKAWRKDMLDLLLDNAFFQMDISCLPFWKQIMDSLMTYDNTTFRELMSRVSLTQTGSLNIFASREQEYEQRSMLLKRLAFVIFCSEFDQYHKYMPEIQEQLTNSLRLLSMVPAVQSAVFLCFRVLLLRMSPDHVTSLWPIIIAEMVQVFLAMEQELKCDSDDLNQQMRFLSSMDASWSAAAANNGLNNQGHLLHWRSVQLEASKLLELGCVLPATNLPHFQMYRWAFVGTEFDAHEEMPFVNGADSDEVTSAILMPQAHYVPHVQRIARLMDMKYTVHSPASAPKRGQHLSLTCQQINTLQDLYGFFSTLRVSCPNPLNYADTDKEVNSCLAEIEDVLAKDFLEKMPNSITPR